MSTIVECGRNSFGLTLKPNNEYDDNYYSNNGATCNIAGAYLFLYLLYCCYNIKSDRVTFMFKYHIQYKSFKFNFQNYR